MASSQYYLFLINNLEATEKVSSYHWGAAENVSIVVIRQGWSLCCYQSQQHVLPLVFSHIHFTRLASLVKSAHLVPLISKVAALGHTYTENHFHAVVPPRSTKYRSLNNSCVSQAHFTFYITFYWYYEQCCSFTENNICLCVKT